MPLLKGKSKQAFSHNVKAEMDAGKPQDQSLAISYEIQRRNKPKKKMAKGGMVPMGSEDDMEPMSMPADKPDNMRPPMDEYMADHFAKGGMPEDDEDHYDNIADAILKKKRKAKMMADGGMVDLEENAEEGPADMDQLNEEAMKKELYDLDQVEDQPMDSNEHGHELSDEDEHDMVSSIRRKMKSKKAE